MFQITTGFNIVYTSTLTLVFSIACYFRHFVYVCYAPLFLS